MLFRPRLSELCYNLRGTRLAAIQRRNHLYIERFFEDSPKAMFIPVELIVNLT